MGREWNNCLSRRLQDSIIRAHSAASIVLVTDLEDTDCTLIEVLSEDERRVVAEFFVRPAKRPKEPRYRDEVLWAAQRRTSATGGGT